MSIKCDHCGRDVPVRPYCYQVSVAHVCGNAGDGSIKPCLGNKKRKWHESLTHPSEVLALQYLVLDGDAHWEGL